MAEKPIKFVAEVVKVQSGGWGQTELSSKKINFTAKNQDEAVMIASHKCDQLKGRRLANGDRVWWTMKSVKAV